MYSNRDSFDHDPSVARSPSHIQSSVSLDILKLFIEFLGKRSISITAGNVTGLSLLCDEFGHANCSPRVSAFWKAEVLAQVGQQAPELAPRKRENDTLKTELARLSGQLHNIANLTPPAQCH
jgi:hypothetical protein